MKIQKTCNFIDKKLEEHRQWLRDMPNAEDEFCQSLDSACNNNGPIALALAASPLKFLGHLYGVRATAASTTDAAAGFNIRLAISCHELSVRCSFQAHYSKLLTERRIGMLYGDAPVAACLVAAKVFLDGDVASYNVFRWLRALAEDPQAAQWWSERSFESCVLVLAEDRQRELLASVNGQALGPYEGLLVSWNDDEDFKLAITKCCDEHLRRMFSSGSEDGEFDLAPFDLIPFEIHAFLSIRQREVGYSPEIVHPLIEKSRMPRIPTGARAGDRLDALLAEISDRLEAVGG